MISFYYGDEEFNISLEIAKAKSKLDKNFLEMSYKEFTAPDFPTLMSILQSQPMMFGKMLIVVNCIQYFLGKSKSENEESSGTFNDKQLDEITSALDSVNENIDIIFVAIVPPDPKKKMDKRKKIFKLFSKYNSKEFAKIPDYKVADIQNWLLTYAKSQNINLTPDVAQTMVSQVGGQLRLLASELEKLYIYANGKTITKSMVNELCVSIENVFNFADLIVGKNKIKALAEYNKLLQTSHVLQLLSFLHTALHTKILIKFYSKSMIPDEISKITGMHPYRIKCEIDKMRAISLKELINIKKTLTDIEYKCKTGQAKMELEKELEYAILQ